MSMDPLIANEKYDKLMREIQEYGPKILNQFKFGQNLDSEIQWKLLSEEFIIRRDNFISKYAWAVPSLEAIDELCQFIGTETCLEIGSGTGLWAYLLRLRGCNIIATDSKVESFKRYYLTDINVLSGKEALLVYPETNVLLVCWSRTNPANMFRGNKYICIGEGDDGCTGGWPNEEEKEDWILQKIVPIPQWIGIKDNIYLFVRK